MVHSLSLARVAASLFDVRTDILVPGNAMNITVATRPVP